jgi:formyl-CoA transferase
MRHATIAPYGPYPTRDGQVVVVAVQTEDEWRRLAAQVLEQPDLADDPRFQDNTARVQNQEALEEVVAAGLRRYDRPDLLAKLDAAQIARGSVHHVGDLWHHPQLRARRRFARVPSPVGEIEVLLPPAALSGMVPRLDRIPAPGEDTVPVLQELGYGEEEISRFAHDGAI